MPMNIGYIEVGGQGLRVRIYYNTGILPLGDLQPLTDGPRGYCLDVMNMTDPTKRLVIAPPLWTVSGLFVDGLLGMGDPIITGDCKSRTASEMGLAGYLTRGSVGSVQVL